MDGQENRIPIELSRSVDDETGAEALRILNWYFDERPDCYLIQKPRTAYDGAGNMKTTVRYEIRHKERTADPAAGQEQETEQTTKGESNQNEQGTIQQ